jgi:hypothetical protein
MTQKTPDDGWTSLFLPDVVVDETFEYLLLECTLDEYEEGKDFSGESGRWVPVTEDNIIGASIIGVTVKEVEGKSYPIGWLRRKNKQTRTAHKPSADEGMRLTKFFFAPKANPIVDKIDGLLLQHSYLGAEFLRPTKIGNERFDRGDFVAIRKSRDRALPREKSYVINEPALIYRLRDCRLVWTGARLETIYPIKREHNASGLSIDINDVAFFMWERNGEGAVAGVRYVVSDKVVWFHEMT